MQYHLLKKMIDGVWGHFSYYFPLKHSVEVGPLFCPKQIIKAIGAKFDNNYTFMKATHHLLSLIISMFVCVYIFIYRWLLVKV